MHESLPFDESQTPISTGELPSLLEVEQFLHEAYGHYRYDDDGNAAVFTGCNSGSTTVEVADATLTFGPIAMTKMACPGAASELEATVTTVLDGEVDYTVDGDTLTITKGSQGLVYRAT